jgi:UDP-N-acetyl-D-mannosaminuronate dehydrogenase
VLKRFLEKLDKKTAVIGVVGLGYVGLLPLMLRYVEINRQ